MSRTLETLTIKAEEIRKGDQSLTDKGSVAWTALNDAGVDSLGAVVVIVEWIDGGREPRAWLPGTEIKVTRGGDWRATLRAPLHE